MREEKNAIKEWKIKEGDFREYCYGSAGGKTTEAGCGDRIFQGWESPKKVIIWSINESE